MNIPDHIVSFWRSFVQSQPVDPTDRFFEAFHFDDNEASANELAQLVLAGKKRASAGLVWSFDAVSAPLPKAGDLSVVTDWAERPLCVIRTERVDVVAYDEVSAAFAATEGEGDGSLQYWRRVHWAAFERACRRMGRMPELKMPVACERFSVVFRGDSESN